MATASASSMRAPIIRCRAKSPPTELKVPATSRIPPRAKKTPPERGELVGGLSEDEAVFVARRSDLDFSGIM